MRILLIGKAGAGKDTVADYLAAGYGFIGLSFAAKLKEIAKEMFPGLWVTDRRAMLQALGMKFREIEEGVWVDYVVRQVDGIDRAVITDCRYENEYHRCKEEGFIAVKIGCGDDIRAERLFKRDGRHMTPAELSHISEQLVVPFDYYLDNNGDEEFLHKQIDEMLERISRKMMEGEHE